MTLPEPLAFNGRHNLGVVQEMPQFRALADETRSLTRRQRELLIRQTELLVRGFYVHLPLKQAMHAIDPEQRLRLLAYRMDGLADPQFHAELLDIISGLRDLHTNYGLPAPYRGRFAFLGILLERYIADGKPRWMVSKVADHLVGDPDLTDGVLVTHWNGMPIEVAAWRNADREAGSNLAARLARGLETMALRPLSSSLPPDEDWVDLRYLPVDTDHPGEHRHDEPRETRLVWRVFEGGELLTGSADPQALLDAITTPLRYQVAVDRRTELARRAKKRLFSPTAIQEEKRVAKYGGVAPRSTAALKRAGIIATNRPDEITAKTVTTPHGEFGYLRLWTFHMQDNDFVAFLLEVARLVGEELPRNGLIIDVRGNGGGFVIAAEFLLQLFTPRRIEPEPTQFINTPTTLALTKAVAAMAPWHQSIADATETGAVYSSAIPLSSPEIVNLFGQLYHSPVVLITDAFCYSACDMFAAGFQDHGIGTVLGTDANTGAGGANVMDHEDLRQDWPDGPLERLPTGVQLRVAIRRTLRVDDHAGQPLEDLGVVPDEVHEMTHDDLLHGNRDLMARAGEILASGTPRVLDVEIRSIQGTTVELRITTDAVATVDVYVNDRPKVQLDTSAGTTDLQLPLGAPTATVRFEGFDGGALVAARRLDFPLSS